MECNPMQPFRLAPMTRDILVLTVILLLLPVAMLIGVLAAAVALVVPLALICLIYAWVWLRFRPVAFIIDDEMLEVAWPMKRRRIRRADIRDARLITPGELQREIGSGFRVGAGGLWGAFGWLYTKRRGIVQMYVSRTRDQVWIDRGPERPWLITPERPEEFIRAVLPDVPPTVRNEGAADGPAASASLPQGGRG
jgi:hypothetical protein